MKREGRIWGYETLFMENVVDVWIDLKEPLSWGDFAFIYELMQEIYGMQQGSKSFTDFYSNLKIIWEELEIHLPIHTCTCFIKCSREAMHSARKHHNYVCDQS